MTRQVDKRERAGAVRCGPGVAWSVEKGSVVIIHPDAGVTCVVEYPGAAIWDLLMLGYPRQAISRVVALLENASMEAAEAVVDQHITGWRKTGFLAEE